MPSPPGGTRAGGPPSAAEIERLRRRLEEGRALDREPEPADIMRNAARSMHVVGGVMETSAGGSLRRPGTWLATMGRRLTGLVEAAVPGTIRHMVFRHVTIVLYAFAGVALVLGLLFGFARPFRPAALTLLAVVGAVDLTVVVLAALMRRATMPARVVGIAAGVVLVAVVAGSLVLGFPRLGDWVRDRVRPPTQRRVVVGVVGGQTLFGVLQTPESADPLVLCGFPASSGGPARRMVVPRANLVVLSPAPPEARVVKIDRGRCDR